MRLSLTIAAFLLATAPALHAQDATKSFTATGPAEAQACAAAKQQARDWAKAGKAEGRLRTLVDDGQCQCTASADGQSCKLDIQVRDVKREAEES
jgi:hypothetical protein